MDNDDLFEIKPVIRITVSGVKLDARACRYVLAGQVVACQHEVPALSAYSDGYASERFSELLSNVMPSNVLNAANSSLQYFGHAPFANSVREIRYWRFGHRGQIDIDGEPVCQVNFNESHIHVLNGQPLDEDVNLEVVTGPALILLLAHQSTYCMHAGAVATPAGNIAFIAESGAGKSTLSRHFDDQWRQISDDILPIQIASSSRRVSALPAYPQLKLDDNSVLNGLPKTMPLHLLVRVNPEPSAITRFIRLPRTQGMIQVVRHTVAAKLFDTSMLGPHAEFAKQVSVSVPIIELSYPRKMAQLDDLRRRIVTYLENPVLQNAANTSA